MNVLKIRVRTFPMAQRTVARPDTTARDTTATVAQSAQFFEAAFRIISTALPSRANSSVMSK